jgi:thymidylate synthase (FAD)
MIEKGYTIPVLGQGYVRYIDHLGDDLRIVETARISYKSPSKGEEADKKLLMYLHKNRHTSPFESCSITFNIKMPIFCMRQFVRHRTFRLNEWSGRYSELADEFYMPQKWRIQDTKNKQGSLELTGATESEDFWHSHNTSIAESVFKSAYAGYQELLSRGVAKELARIVLPVSMFTEIYVSCDVHNLMHFLNLRQDPHAQLEIREVADAMASIFKELYPWSYEAHIKHKLKMIEA